MPIESHVSEGVSRVRRSGAAHPCGRLPLEGLTPGRGTNHRTFVNVRAPGRCSGVGPTDPFTTRSTYRPPGVVPENQLRRNPGDVSRDAAMRAAPTLVDAVRQVLGAQGVRMIVADDLSRRLQQLDVDGPVGVAADHRRVRDGARHHEPVRRPAGAGPPLRTTVACGRTAVGSAPATVVVVGANGESP